MRFIKAFFFIVASAVMALTMLFIPQSSGTVSIAYTSVLGIYLSLDIAAMISRTTMLKKGDYEAMNVYKYILASICLCILICISLYMKSKGIDLNSSITSFMASAMIILGCVIGGLEGNKIATDIDGTV